MYKKGSYITARAIGAVFFLILCCVVAVQTPYVQTRVTKKALSRLLEKLPASVTYNRIEVMSSGVLKIDGLAVTDSSPYTLDVYQRGWDSEDTLFRAKSITATFTLASLFAKEGVHMGRVSIEDGYMHLIIEPGKRNNIIRMFNLSPATGPVPPGGKIFDIRKVRLKNFRYRMNNFDKELYPHTGKGINFEDLDVTVSELRGHSLKMAGGVMSGTCDFAAMKEKSGFNVHCISGKASVGQGKTLVEDLHIIDDYSDIRLAHYKMSYRWGGDFAQFISKVLIDAKLRRSSVAMKSISYFSKGVFDHSPSVFDIRKGSFRGYVNDFTVTGIDFSDKGTGVSGKVQTCTLTGIPDIADSYLSTKIGNLSFTTRGLSRLLSGLSPAKLDFSSLTPGERYSAEVEVEGPFKRLSANLRLSSKNGGVYLDGMLRNLMTSRPLEMDLRASTSKFDIGSLLSTDKLGQCSMMTAARIKLNPGNPEINVDTIHVASLNALGYNYSDIHGNGSLRNHTLAASLNADDPNLKFSLSGLTDLQTVDGYRRYKLVGSFPTINLSELNLDKRGASSRASLGLYLNAVQDSLFLKGEGHIGDLCLESSGKKQELGDITLRAHPSGKEQCYRLESGFLSGALIGSGTLVDFISDVQKVTTRRELPALYRDSLATLQSTGAYDLQLRFHDSRPLMSFVSPGLYIADGTDFVLSMDRDGDLSARLSSPRLASGTTYIKDVSLVIDNFASSLNIDLTGTEASAGSLGISKPSANVYAHNNQAQLAIRYDNSSEEGGFGDIFINVDFLRDPSGQLAFRAHPLNSLINDGVRNWELGESDLLFSKGDILISNFSLESGLQSIHIDGGLSNERADTLSLKVNNLDLSIIDLFLKKKSLVSGSMGGEAFIISDGELAKGMLMNFKTDSLAVAGRSAGDITLASSWRGEGREIGIYLLDRLEGRDMLFIDGIYMLDSRILSLSTHIDKFPFELVEPFVSPILSELGGSLSGRMEANGPLEELSVQSSDLFISDMMARIGATGARYFIRGPIDFDHNAVLLNGIDIRDDSNGRAILDGTLNLTNLKQPHIQANIAFQNLKAIDFSEKESKNLYGLIRASGSADISGPFSALNIDADISSSGPGELRVPTSGSLTSTTSDLLVFTERKKEIDPYEEMLARDRQERKSSGDLKAHARVNISPEVQIIVEIDKSTGNMARFTGAGDLSVNLRPSKDIFSLNGDYNIRNGLYQFVLPGILAKDFSIEDGSSIRCNGDILNTEMDIDAKYSLKTSLGSLITDTTSVSSRRLVECGLNIAGRLNAPELTFAIDVPDLDPTTRTQVESALNTSDKIQKQFVALLLMGSFIPSESSGVFNSYNVLYSSVTSLMANQINQILQRLDIPLDIGFGYQTGTTGKDIFDVAISTQLFNNRVIVGGSVGNRQYRSSGGSSNVVGDLDIQVKLDPRGQFRLNLFSHSADDYTNFLDNSQRNGGGFSYQREYRSVGGFFQSIFSSKKKRQQRDSLDRERRGEAVHTIKIEAENEQ